MDDVKLREIRGFGRHEPVPVYKITNQGSKANYDFRSPSLEADAALFGEHSYQVGCPMSADEQAEVVPYGTIIDDNVPTTTCIQCPHLKGLGRKDKTQGKVDTLPGATKEPQDMYEILCTWPKHRQLREWYGDAPKDLEERTEKQIRALKIDPTSPKGVALMEVFGTRLVAVACPISDVQTGNWMVAPPPCLECSAFRGLHITKRGEMRIRCAHPSHREIKGSSRPVNLGSFQA